MSEELKQDSTAPENKEVVKENVEAVAPAEKEEEIINPEEIEKIIEKEGEKKVDDVLADIVVDEKNKKKIKNTDIKVGMYLRIYQRISELNAKGEEKSRLQMFEGLVIAKKHGNEPGSTFMVRKVTKTGHTVERIYPTYLPTLEKIEVMKIARNRKSKMYFLRTRKAKKLKFTK